MKKLEDIAKQLSGKINQEHYVLHYLKRVYEAGYREGTKNAPS